MFSNDVITAVVNGLVTFATDFLMPLMVLGFVLGITFRFLNYFTLKRQAYFAREFAKRVDGYIHGSENDVNVSFYGTMKKLLMITYYELFEVTALIQRRKPDMIMSFTDRAFLIKPGFAWLLKDIMKQVKYLKHNAHTSPKFTDITKNSFQKNPCLTKVFGYVPSGLLNDVLTILPGMFIVGGIFGTFLGIMKALPELSQMNLNDIEGTKLVMDQFLLKISFSMSTSIIGIALSLAMSVFNTFFSAEKAFLETIDTFSSTMNTLWNRSDNNHFEAISFDEHKDPIEALAEESLNREYEKARGERYNKNEKLEQPSQKAS